MALKRIVKYPYFRVSNWQDSLGDCLPMYEFLKAKGIKCWIVYDESRSKAKRRCDKNPYAVWREGLEAVQHGRPNAEGYSGEVVGT